MEGRENNFPVLSLAAWRVNAKLTQKELAAKCHVSESTVVAWESGKRSPNIRKLVEIERALGVSLNYIRFGD